MEFAESAKNSLCHDCKKKIEIKDGKIKNGVLLSYKEGSEEIGILKCKQCFEKDPSLTNFRKCEVYSRIVGYLRPVRQWNLGKVKEFKQRKEFKLKGHQIN